MYAYSCRTKRNCATSSTTYGSGKESWKRLRVNSNRYLLHRTIKHTNSTKTVGETQSAQDSGRCARVAGTVRLVGHRPRRALLAQVPAHRHRHTRIIGRARPTNQHAATQTNGS
jgi:hypothetical protein